MSMVNSRQRIESIDLLRGLVMLLMTVDHLRDYVVPGDPVDLSHGRFCFFIVRWISHFCAPTFVLLAGLSVYFYGKKHTKSEVARFLWTRGAFLIFLELTIVSYAWYFDPTQFAFQVIWALGASMLLLGCMIYAPPAVTLFFGIVTIGCHNLLNGFQSSSFLWAFVHQTGDYKILNCNVEMLYTLIPWVGVMFVGYGLGHFAWEHPRRNRLMLIGGVAMTLGFVALRWSNIYGDPTPWRPQKDGWMTVASFLNCAKYPASLCFLLMTLGPMLVLFSYLNGGTIPSILKPLVTIGRVPLFYYLIHLYVIRFAAMGLAWVQTGDPFQGSWVNQEKWVAAGFGIGLPALCLGALVITGGLYYPCLWYDHVKSTRRSVWFKYI